MSELLSKTTKTRRSHSSSEKEKEKEKEMIDDLRAQMSSVHAELTTKTRRRSHYIKSMFKTQAPLLIITAGPTGSGKSRMSQLVYNILYNTKSRSTKFDEFYIDDYIANSSEYKHAVMDIIEMYNITNRTTINDGMFKAFEDAYFSVREEWNQPFMNDVLRARDAGKNVVIETTGKKIPTKYIDEFAGYNIVFVYSFAQFDTMIGRNISRFKENINAFMRDPDSNPAPRLPDMNPESYAKRVQTIETQLGVLRDNCLNITTAGRSSDCGDIKNSQRFNLLIVDNTGAKPEIIYDHRKHDRFQDRKSFHSLIRNTVGFRGGQRTKRTKPRMTTKKRKSSL